ncbi:MAG: alpha-glucan family phosphorylase [Anaerolineales bacterium]|nr:alpha-glucan family phosphorylase [Anaerolineales bacterium]
MAQFRATPPNLFSLPRRIARLGELAYNLWWTWNPEAERLFKLIDTDLWEAVGHNPISFLNKLERSQINSVTYDRYYLELYDRVFRAFDKYMQADFTWFKDAHADLNEKTLAYFSMEFGLHECLPIYAGGLGVLAGDHLKEASDLGLPIVGVGLLYINGYFSQRLTEDGWQEMQTFELDLKNVPISEVLDEEKNPLLISVVLPGRRLYARVWEARVGRVPLYLLDSNVEQNEFKDRSLTSRLYNSDPDVRISQYLLQGVGGIRALRAMGHTPNAWHLNEGHSAFLGLELVRELVKQGLPFEEARLQLRDHAVFTTHTPVPAGNDEFPLWQIDKFFAAWWTELGLTREQFIALAANTQEWGETFSMPILAMRFAENVNGVSELHGQVSRKMWHKSLWADKPVEEVPITHVTNGIHTGTWLARRMRGLFDRYLGPEWIEHADDPLMWEYVESIPDRDLWVVRRHLKRKMAYYIRERARKRWIKGGFHPIQVIAEGALLDPYALTIGFARRFAPYKRADLILSDLDRLLKLLNVPNQPLQIIFAGKSHPDHEQGKRLIQEVYRTVKLAENGGRLVFLENYDMNIARYLVQGVDVWMNTPRRPNEASGTSGMKAALNGVLNFSILDGWWREGFNGKNGWAIGNEQEFASTNEQDKYDANSLYDILEKELIPLYYKQRSSDGLPGEWIARVKECIRTLGPAFSTRRMVKEYAERMYVPALQDDEEEGVEE